MGSNQPHQRLRIETGLLEMTMNDASSSSSASLEQGLQDIMLTDSADRVGGGATEEHASFDTTEEAKSTTPRFAAPLAACSTARSTQNSSSDMVATASCTISTIVKTEGFVPPPKHAVSFFADSSPPSPTKEQGQPVDAFHAGTISIQSHLFDNTITSDCASGQGEEEEALEEITPGIADKDQDPPSFHPSQNISSSEPFLNMSVSTTPSSSPSEAATKKKQRKSNKNSPKDGQSTGRWTDEEHQAFLRGLHTYGREWKKVASHIPTRSSAQVRSHAQKYFAKLQKDEESWVGHFAGASAEAAGLVCNAVSHEDASGTGMEGMNHVSSSVQANVARIIAHPENAEREVEDTLRQLRARYEALQRRLEQTSSSSPANPDSPNRKRRIVTQPIIPHDDQSSTTSLSSLQNEELIALSVLRGGLPRGDASVGASELSEENMETDDSTGSVSKRAKRD
uniref:Uncharacterized protein n=1 Tax=Amphora coffeiformis TaxID=265554 RepID=A0A6S8K8Y0_9STRA|mmetsp:Transcript_19064/g.38539  ORF Transcript_19064/g.38539 Transcript_19064/m.38539 type:complete len:454 (-) Transcript_19064:144-1505(-)